MSSRSIAQAQFANTRWTLVAALKDGEAGAQRHLLELCLQNWFPVYSYLRRCGHAPDNAQAMSRAFFEQLLREGPARAVNSDFGRFRQFLLAELHRFLALGSTTPSSNAPEPPLSIAEMESRQLQRGDVGGSPEQALRRGFALEIIATALRRLRAEAGEAGRLELFEALERFLTVEPQPGEVELVAGQFKLRPLFVLMATKRLRERFRELIDTALGDTVLNTEELEVERRALQQALAGEDA